MQQKKLLIIGGVVLVIVLLIAGYFLFLRPSSQKPEAQNSTPVEEEVMAPTIAPSALGLQFVARADGKAVKFTIENAEDIESVDYEISYMAEGNIPRGAIGRLEKKEGDSTIASNYIDLGTCSSGKCKYDAGVTSVKLILKIAKTDGKSYAAEKSLEL